MKKAEQNTFTEEVVKEKKKYLPPKMEVTIVEMESSVAVGSAKVQFDGENTAELPMVEAWEEKKDQQFWDF